MNPLLFLLVVLFSVSAYAEPFTYAPDTCDMQVAFPEKPFIETKCMNEGARRNCSDVVTFKKISPPEAGLNVRVTCVAYDQKELNSYTPEVVEETLKRMTKAQNMETYDISSDALEDGLRRSSTLSIGSKENVPYIYTAQIWIGKESMFTIEAEMKGPENEQIDKIFAEILKSTHAKKDQEKDSGKKAESKKK